MNLHGGFEGFDWDEGNASKNWEKHQISIEECEEVFSNRPFYIFDDEKHSVVEKRQIVFGQTDTGKRLFVSFTVRNNCVRIISARKMNDREKEKFDERL